MRSDSVELVDGNDPVCIVWEVSSMLRLTDKPIVEQPVVELVRLYRDSPICIHVDAVVRSYVDGMLQRWRSPVIRVYDGLNRIVDETKDDRILKAEKFLCCKYFSRRGMYGANRLSRKRLVR